MRSRIDWLAYAVLISALAACSKSNDASDSSDAAVSGDENSHGGAGQSSSSTSGSSGSGGSTKTGSNTSSSTQADGGTNDGSSSSTGTKSDGGSSNGNSSGDKGGSGGSNGSAANGGSGDQGNSSSLPTDGNQLALCSMAEGDCNKGLACSATTNALSSSRGFCSKICTSDDDCSGVDPSSAKYTCSTGGTRVCEVACSGTDDTSCPSNMACVETGVTVERAANGGSGGGSAPMPTPTAGAGGGTGMGRNPFVGVYHCRYPLETSPMWGPCQDGQHQCDKDATCYGTGAGRAGVCTKTCTMDSDCGDKPSSGSITPSCATITAARGNTPEQKLCVLSCLDMMDGCPDGTSCVDGPRIPQMMTNPRGMGGMGRGPATGGGAGAAATSEPSYARCE